MAVVEPLGPIDSEFVLHERLSADCFVLADLPLCRWLLMNDANFPWCILVPRRTDIREIYQLSAEDQGQLIRESSALGRAMMTALGGEKLNVGALGNLVPQLHVHHIVRFSTDAAWPAPVWGKLPARPYDERFLRELCHRLMAQWRDLSV